MWPRIVELLLSAWLATSPWIISAPADGGNFLHWNALICAALIALFALLSFRSAWNKMHLLSLGVALWLIGVAFLQPNPPPPAAYQNFVVTGLTLLLFAVVPSRASELSQAWREFYRGNDAA
jgi:hypothetical protein